MKRVIASIITFSILFGCIHNYAYASDFIAQNNEEVVQEESSDGYTVEIPDETPAKAANPDDTEENTDENGTGTGENSKTEDEQADDNGNSEAGQNPTGENPSGENPSVDGSDDTVSEGGNGNSESGNAENPSEENSQTELLIISQSEDACVYIGETVTFFVETTAVKPKYEWNFSKDGGETWQKCGYNGYRTGCLSFAAQSYQYGYKFKCTVRDEDLQEVTSNVFTICEKATKIVEQSTTVAANIGDTVTLSVKAEGNKLSYRWYYSQDGGSTWKKAMNYTVTDDQGNKTSIPYEGIKDTSLSFTVTNSNCDYLYKCAITDRAGNIIETDNMSLLSEGAAFSEQPKDEYRLLGEKATFHVVFQSPAANYQWLISKDKGLTWQKCGYNGYKTDTLSFDVQSYQYGYRFKCQVTDKSGKSTVSDECVLYEKETTLTTVSNEIEAEIGKEVSIEVAAEGNKLTYRWYYSTDSGESWNKCMSYAYTAEDGTRTSKKYDGYSTGKLSFTVQDVHVNMLFRCTVSDRRGKEYLSDNVALKVKLPELTISEQPQDVYGLINDEAIISVKAEGTSLKYLWYISKNNGETWTKSGYNGYKTSTLSFPIKSYQYGYMFYCVIEDKQGRKVTSDTVTIYEKETSIIKEPEDVVCESGDKVELFVEAEGNMLSYLWQRSIDDGENWETCSTDTYEGVDSEKLSFVANEETAKYVYRCEITDRIKSKTYSRTVRIEVKEADKLITLGDIDLESDNSLSGLSVILSREYIKENAVISENGSRTSLILSSINAATGSDVFLLHFFAKSEGRNSDITIKINNSKYTGNFTVPTYITEYVLPVKGLSKIDKLTVDATDYGQKIKISNFEVLSIDDKNLSEINLGPFDRDEAYQNILVSEDSAIGYQAVDLLSDGEYLYSLGKGELVIYTVDSGISSVVGSLNGLGNAREMVFSHDGNALIVSSRENGIFTVDISDKTTPRIMAEMPSQGLSTGLCVQDNYCFVASRRFGVEIYDITDLSNPFLVTLISGYNEEFYDCSIDGQYLYVSSWAESKISVFDIKNIASPEKVTEFFAGGRAAGTVIRDSLLYIATGYHSKDSSANVASPGYGMGNGLDIYDISNPASPKKVSSTKIDGRFFYSGFDHWNVEISGNYAFFSNAFTGIHVIDISDPYAPKKLSNIGVDIPEGSKNYKTIVSDTYVLPYDSTRYTRAIITTVAITDGGIYYATSTGNSYYGGVDIDSALGLYYQPLAGLVRENIKGGTCDYIVAEKNVDDVEFTADGVTVRETAKGEDIWSVCGYDGKYYCATGKNEIAVLNKNYEVIERHATSGVTKDAVVVNGVLYVAESNAGLGAYAINGDSLEKIGSVTYDSYSSVFTTVNVVDDNYLIAQVSWTRYAVINITDPANLKIAENISAGSMYDRSLLGQTGRCEYQSVFSRNALIWYKANESGRPKIIKKFTTTRYAEQNGIAYGNGYAVTIYNNGYFYYDPSTITQGEYTALPTITVPGTKLRGMPNIRDNIMVVTNCFGRKVTIVDIKDIENPVLITEFSVDGNPDEVYADEEGKYIIPLRHGGIMEIKMN